MAINIDALRGKLKAHQEKGGGSMEYPPTVFLPDGNHKVRFIVDPTDEFMCEYYSFGYFGRGIRDPLGLVDRSGIPEGFENELPELAKKISELGKYSYGAKYNMIVYMYLYDTDAKSEDWKPNTLYAVIGNRKFSEAYINFISTLAQEAPEAILDILNPSKPANLLNLSYKGGRDGNCSIGGTFPAKTVDPINMEGVPYIPLEQCYIKPGFSIEKYNALVEKYKKDLAQLQAAKEARMAANGGVMPEGEPSAPSVEATGQSLLSTQPAPEVTQAPASEVPFEGGVKVDQSSVTQPSQPAVTEAPLTPSSDDPWARFKTA